jgi:uncharacterized repeat protein (TIGR04138 family)
MSLECPEHGPTADLVKSEQARFRQVIRTHGDYPLGAYEFLYAGLDRATRTLHGQVDADSGPHHVSGQQLCGALRDLAIERWGPLARSVLACWNIHRTRDFGAMVFLLVEHEFMGRQDSDSIDDFDQVYDFADAFGDYEIPLDHFDTEHPAPD